MDGKKIVIPVRPRVPKPIKKFKTFPNQTKNMFLREKKLKEKM